MSNGSLAILNDAFVRIYRSFTQYMHEARPVFDIGPEVLPALIDRESEDATRLGTYLVDRQGNVELGTLRSDLGHVHFVNASRLLPDWKKAQRQLVAELESDRAKLAGADATGLAILDDILNHERQSLASLEQLLPEAQAKQTSGDMSGCQEATAAVSGDLSSGA